MTLAEDVVALQARLADAERQRSRAEGARDNAQSAYDEARTRLKNEFGVDTIDEAATLLDDLRKELTGIVEQISAKLDQVGF